MQLNIKNRESSSKGYIKRLRKEHKIPAVIYEKGKESRSILIDALEFQAHLRAISSGHLPTTRFSLTDESGTQFQAVVKGLEYHVTSYDILHLDFQKVQPDERIQVKVPIELSNRIDCQGVKLGGVIRQPLRHVKVSCVGRAIPSSFSVDMTPLLIGDSFKVSDLSLNQEVVPITKNNEVIVLVAKK